MSIIVLSGCLSRTKKFIPAWESEKSIRAHQTKKGQNDSVYEEFIKPHHSFAINAHVS